MTPAPTAPAPTAAPYVAHQVTPTALVAWARAQGVVVRDTHMTTSGGGRVWVAHTATQGRVAVLPAHEHPAPPRAG